MSARLSWQEQREVWNREGQCAREACRASIRPRRPGKISAGRHSGTGLLYCISCTIAINDANPAAEPVVVFVEPAAGPKPDPGT